MDRWRLRFLGASSESLDSIENFTLDPDDVNGEGTSGDIMIKTHEEIHDGKRWSLERRILVTAENETGQEVVDSSSENGCGLWNAKMCHRSNIISKTCRRLDSLNYALLFDESRLMR